MTTHERIKQIEKELAEVKKELEVKEKKPFPQVGDWYWYCDDTGDIDTGKWDGGPMDKYRLLHRKVFRTGEQAKLYLKIETDLLSGEVDWKNLKENRFFPSYLVENDEVTFTFSGEYLFSNTQKLKTIIDKWGDDLKWFFRHKMGIE